jgi:hypothetical protein
MSMTDILQELPKLTPEERATILRRLRELDGSDGSVFLHEAAEALSRDTEQQEAASPPAAPSAVGAAYL